MLIRSLLTLFILGGFPLLAVKFEMKDLAYRNLVLVNSEALLERTVAVSHFASGWLELTPDNLESLSAEFELDVRTLETGLELKNIQLREQLLSTQEFPIAKATCSTPTGFQKTKLVDRKPLTIPVECSIKIKNTQKTIPLTLKLIYFKENEESRQRLTGNLLKISTTWDLDLASFGISIPAKYSSLIAKTVQVNVDMVGSDRLPDNSLSLPEGIKKK
jgi:polyisoprenoid-binding protein YceI